MTHDKEVAYISGAISSDPNYRAKFADAETVLMNLVDIRARTRYDTSIKARRTKQ